MRNRQSLSVWLAGVALAVLCQSSRTAAQSLPTGGSVASGRATISTSGSTLTVNQSTGNAIINWQSFSVGQGDKVSIRQPNAQSDLLSRVTGNTSSVIAGQISANGQFVLVNPNGILITKSGVVNAGGGFAASTLALSDADFKAGKLKFAGNGASAAISNQGVVTVGRGGYAALIGGTVTNGGLIAVPLGRVALGSGEAATLDVSGDGFLQVAVPTASGGGSQALIQSSGTIAADGGLVVMDAATARTAARQAINISGNVEARSISGHSGAIVLGGGAGGAVAVSGNVSVAGGAQASGGTVAITGQTIALTGARINASGGKHGGRVHIGGKPQIATSPTPQAGSLTVDASSTLTANATGAGDGGNIVLWSTGQTSVYGHLSAQGGPQGGNGGSIETSGHALSFTGASVDASAAKGKAGTWLLDPYNLTIGTSDAATISTDLNAGTNVTLTTTSSAATSSPSGIGTSSAGNGDIFINSAIAWGSTATLALSAYHSIAIDAGISISGAGGLTLTTNNGGSNGTLTFGTGLGTPGAVAFTDVGASGRSLTINGTSYQFIDTMAQLAAINGSNGAYALAQPLISATTYSSAVAATFGGTLEGLGNTISNLTILNSSGNANIGLIGQLGSGGTIRDIGLTGGSVTGTGTSGYNMGALVGNNAGTILQSYATGNVTITQADSGDYIGGLVGNNQYGGTITASYATGNVGDNGNNVAGGQIGGLVGANAGAIAQSFATGWSSDKDNGNGGLVGLNQSNSGSQIATITNSYATGAVTGNAADGGLAGGNLGGVITNSYSTGKVSGGGSVGGLVGVNSTGGSGTSTGTITNSYWDETNSGISSGSNGTPETTATMQSSSFATTLGSAFAGGSSIYPYLTSINAAGVQVIYGTIFAGAGVNPVLTSSSGAGTAAIFVNGVAFGSASTNGSGIYSFQAPAGTVSAGTSLLVAATQNTATGEVNGGNLNTTGATALDVYGGYFYDNTSQTSYSASNVATVLGYLSTPTALASLPFAINAVGASYTFDTALTLSKNLTLNVVAGEPVTVAAPITLQGSNTLTLGGNNGGALTINAEIAVTGTGTVNLNAATETFTTTTGGHSVTPVNMAFGSGGSVQFTNGGAGALAIDGSSYTLIDSMAQLANINTTGLGGNYALAQPLTAASSYGGALIGSSSSPFTGVFEGLGNTITNLTISASSSNVVGLFGAISGTSATVRDLGLVGGSVTAQETVGALAGANIEGLFLQDYATGSVTGSADSVGGLVGASSGFEVNSYATGAVSGNGAVGGLVGHSALAGGAEYGLVTASYATGNVTGTGSGAYIGGLVGSSEIAVTNSYATGTVSGPSYAGGLVGLAYYNSGNSAGSNPAPITNSYATGAVTATTYAGGLVASNNSTNVITASHATGSVATTSSTGTNTGGLVGYDQGTILNAWASGAVSMAGTASGNHAGGLVGDLAGSISKSYATGAVTAGYAVNIGGLVGASESTGSINQSFATGAVTAGGNGGNGGLVGNNSGTITRSYATGAVTATSAGADVGGIAGQFTGTITYSYATGAITAVSGTIGGIYGVSGGGTLSNNYWDTSTTGTSAAQTGGTGLATASLQGSGSAALTALNGGGTVFASGTGLYPYLSNIFGGGVQAVSGFAYKTAGTGSVLASGTSGAGIVSLASGGAALASASTGANGYYYIAVPTGTLATGQNFAVYTQSANGDGAANAASFTQSASAATGVAASGVNIYGGWLTQQTGSALTTMSGLNAAYSAAIGSSALSGLSIANREIDVLGAGFAIDAATTLSGTMAISSNLAVTQSAAVNAGTLLLGGTGAYTLTNTSNQFSTLSANAGALILTDSSSVSVGAASNAEGASTSGLASTGAVNLSVTGGLTLAAAVTPASGSNATLSATGAFTNSVGAGAIATAGSGTWLVYSAAPSGDSFNNLNSGNTAVWNTAAGAAVTASGDRYVFAYQPSLTVTTLNDSKTYGTDVTSALQSSTYYTVTGQAAVANAYLADTTGYYSGTPTLASSGASALADVQGGGYAITATAGSLTAADGYAATPVFVNSGILTINPLAVTLTGTRVYNGSLNIAAANLTLTDGVNGATSGTIGLSGSGSVGSQNVSAGSQALSLTGLSLNSADYTLVGGSGTASITALPVVLSGTQVYNGSTTVQSTNLSVSNLVGADTLTLGGSATMAAKDVVVSGTESLTSLTNLSLSNSNYTIAGGSGAVTVTPASLSIVASNQISTYGTPYTLAGYTPTGLKGSDAITGLTESITVGGSPIGATTLHTAATTYAIIPSAVQGLDNSDYTISYPTTGTLTVNPLAVVLTGTQVYNGTTTAYGANLAVSNAVSGDTVTLTGSGTMAAKDVVVSGTEALTSLANLTPSSTNYTIAGGSGAVTVTPASLSIVASNQISTYGTPYTLAGYTENGLQGTDAITGLTERITVGGSPIGATTLHTAATTYAITPSAVQGLDNNDYTISYPTTGTLTVNPLSVILTGTQVYNGTTAAYGANLTVSNAVSGDTVTLTGSGTMAAKDVVVSGTEALTSLANLTPSSTNYTIAGGSGAVTVTPASLSIVASNQAATYGTPYTLAGYTPTGLKGSDAITGLTESITVGGSPIGATTLHTAATTYAITPSAVQGLDNSDYTISYPTTGTLTVNPLSVILTGTQVYNGTTTAYGANLAVFNAVSGDTITLTGSGTIAAKDVVVSGTEALTSLGTLTPSSTNYTIAGGSGAVTVTPASLSIVASNQTATYGTPYTLAGYTQNGLQGTDAITGLTERITVGGSPVGATTLHTAATTYAITPSAVQGLPANDYTITYPTTGTLTVDPLVVVLSGTQVYNGTTTAYGANLAVSNAVSGDTVTLGGTATMAAKDVVVSGTEALSSLTNLSLSSSNYTLAGGSGAVTVTPAPLSIVASNQTATYGTPYALTGYTPTGLKGSDAITGLTESITVGGSPIGATTLHTAATTYAITPSAVQGLDTSDYTISYPTTGTLTVNPLSVILTGTQVYNGTTTAYGANLAVSNAVSGDTVTLTGSGTMLAKDVVVSGTEALTSLANLSLSSSNYTLAGGSGAVTVTPASLSIVASNQTATYGTPYTLAGYSETGLQGTDAITGLSESITVGSMPIGATTLHTPAASYAITPSAVQGLNASDYTITYPTTGALTVNPLAVVLAGTQVYNGTTTAYGANLSVSNAVSGDTVTLTGSATMAGKDVVVSGTEALTSLGSLTPSSSNYTISGGSGTVTVTPASLSIVANTQSATYGTPYTLSGYTASGLQGTDAITGLTETITAGSSPIGATTLHTPAASYAITPSAVQGLPANDYSITYPTTGTLTVNPLAVILSGAQTYDGTTTAQAANLSVANLVSGDAITLSGTATMAAKDVVVSGTEALTSLANLSLGNSNYTLTGGSGAVTLTPASLSIAASNQIATYGTPYTLSGYTPTGLQGTDAITGLTERITAGSSLLGGTSLHTPAASYAITPSAVQGLDTDDYTITYATTGMLTVNPLAVILSGTQVYNGSTAVQGTNLAVGNLVTGDSLAVRGTATMAAKDVVIGGTEALTSLGNLSLGNSNYTLAGGSGAVTVTPASLSIAANNQISTYGTPITLAGYTATGLQGLDAITGVAEAITVLGSPIGATTLHTPAASYAITPSAVQGLNASDYAITYATTGTLTINRLAVVLAGTQLYNGTVTVQASNLSVADLVAGDTLTLGGTATMAAKDVVVGGTEALSALTNLSLSNSNYTLAGGSGAVTVTPASLSIAANNQTATYGTPYTLTGYSATGLQGTDTISGLSESVTAGGAAIGATTQHTPAASYAITPSAVQGLETNDYRITYTPSGKLTVNPLAVILTGKKVYDGTTQALGSSLTVANLISGDSATLGGAATMAGKNVVPGGTEGLASLSGLTLGNTNYTLIGGAGAMTVTPALITVAGAAGINKTFDGSTSLPAGATGFVYSGILDSDPVSVTAASAAYASAAIGPEAVNVSGLALSGPAAIDYVVSSTSVTGSGTIAAAAGSGAGSSLSSISNTVPVLTTANVAATGSTSIAVVTAGSSSETLGGLGTGLPSGLGVTNAVATGAASASGAGTLGSGSGDVVNTAPALIAPASEAGAVSASPVGAASSAGSTSLVPVAATSPSAPASTTASPTSHSGGGGGVSCQDNGKTRSAKACKAKASAGK